MTDEHEPEELNPEAAEPELHDETEAEPAEAAPLVIEEEPEPSLPAPRLERLQKILAKAGIASRRHAEELITEGRVQVNGQVVSTLGTKADPARDHIRVDGKLLQGAERLRYFMLNKPKGYVTTVSDPEGRPTVMQFFTKMGERLYPVGRLDYLSEGLLLVTNDGELAHALTRAASGVEKTYLVKVAGQPGEDELERLRTGVAIERGKPGEGKVRTAPARIRQVRAGDNPWFEVVLIEGRNRELRKMFEEIGHHVEKIRRVGYGPLVLDLEPGKLRELEPEELAQVRLAAEGKLKPRRMKTTQMLPKEAGRPAGQRFERRPGNRQQRAGRELPEAREAKPFGRKEERWEKFELPERAQRPEEGFGERRRERGPRPGGKPGFGRPQGARSAEKPRFGSEEPGRKPYGKTGFGQRSFGKPFAPRGEQPGEGRRSFGRTERPRAGGKAPSRVGFGGGARPEFGKGLGRPAGRGFGKGPDTSKGPGRGWERADRRRENEPGGGTARPRRSEGEGMASPRSGKPSFQRSDKRSFGGTSKPASGQQGGSGRKPAFGAKPAFKAKPAFGARPSGPGKSGFRGKPGGASRPGGRPGGKPGSRPGSRPSGRPGGRPGGKPGGKPSGGPRGKGRG